MRFDDRRLDELIRRIATFRAVVVHGTDAALVNERSNAILGAAGPRPVWGIVDLDGSDHARALEVIESPMLDGQPPIVRLRGATDAATSSIQNVLDHSAWGLLLVSAGDLPARSRLRLLAEQHEKAAGMLCRNEDPRGVATRLDRILAEMGVKIEPDARQFVLDASAAGGMTAHDSEKVGLFAGSGRTVRLADVQALDRESKHGGLDELLVAVSAGDLAAVDELTVTLLNDGVSPATILRGLLGHFTRIRACRELVDDGASVEQAIAALRPPVFSTRAATLRQGVMGWRLSTLEQACLELWRADMRCRTSSLPAAAICLDVVFGLARR